MNKGTHDKCFKCGKKGHYANDCDKVFENKKNTILHEKYCNKKKSIYTQPINYKYNYSNDDFDSDDYNDNEITCFRCGHYGHYSSSCYAKIHKNGY